MLPDASAPPRTENFLENRASRSFALCVTFEFFSGMFAVFYRERVVM